MFFRRHGRNKRSTKEDLMRPTRANEGVLKRIPPAGSGALHIVVPQVRRPRFLNLADYAKTCGHPVQRRMWARFRKRWYWPYMEADVNYTARNYGSIPRKLLQLRKRTNSLNLFPDKETIICRYRYNWAITKSQVGSQIYPGDNRSVY